MSNFWSVNDAVTGVQRNHDRQQKQEAAKRRDRAAATASRGKRRI